MILLAFYNGWEFERNHIQEKIFHQNNKMKSWNKIIYFCYCFHDTLFWLSTKTASTYLCASVSCARSLLCVLVILLTEGKFTKNDFFRPDRQDLSIKSYPVDPVIQSGISFFDFQRFSRKSSNEIPA